MRACSARSATSSAWSPASRRRRRRSTPAQGLVPRLRAGCWCRSCAISASPRASSPATSSSSSPTSSRSTGRPAPTTISPTCMPGARSICPAPAGSASTRPRACLTGESHIPLAATPHYRNAAPISGHGELRQCRVRLRHAGHPRRRASAHHQALLGRIAGQRSTRSATRSTRVLKDEDVRLTMGGEPTFVSIDDFEAGEWNTAAVGPTKRELADELIRRLRSASRPAACCITARASGIRAKRCRAGPSRSTGARDGKPMWSRRGADRRAKTPIPAPARPTPRSCSTAIAADLGVEADTIAAGLRGPGRMAAQGRQASRQCRSRPTPSSTTRRSARAWRASSSAA